MKKWIHIVPVLGMSLSKADLVKKLNGRGEAVTEHIAKCVLYGTSLGLENYDHWIETEIANWISEVNDLTCKPSNKKLKPEVYREEFFGSLGDDDADAKANLSDVILANRKTQKYPELDITRQDVAIMYTVSQAVIHEFVPILSSKNDFDKKDIDRKLHKILDKYCA